MDYKLGYQRGQLIEGIIRVDHEASIGSSVEELNGYQEVQSVEEGSKAGPPWTPIGCVIRSVANPSCYIRDAAY